MKCSKCNAEIADNAKFCLICGAKVEKLEPIKECPNCGEHLKEGAKFCAKCGCKIEMECKCPQCGNVLKDGTKFCHVCGTKIVGSNEDFPSQSAICEKTEILVENSIEPLPIANSTASTKKQKKSDKTIIIIAIAIFAIVVVAIIAITLASNSESQSNYSSNKYSSNSNLSNTYYNEYIYFNYPSNYKITDEERNEDGEISLNCEIKSDDLAIITITNGYDASLSFYDGQDLNEICKETLKSFNNELRSSGYGNVKISGMSRKAIGYNYSGYYNDFTAEVYSNPIKGYVFVGTYGNNYVTIFAQAENDKYLRQLDDILKTLMYTYDGRGDDPDYDDV